jgi:hypothetical protein
LDFWRENITVSPGSPGILVIELILNDFPVIFAWEFWLKLLIFEVSRAVSFALPLKPFRI